MSCSRGNGFPEGPSVNEPCDRKPKSYGEKKKKDKKDNCAFTVTVGTTCLAHSIGTVSFLVQRHTKYGVITEDIGGRRTVWVVPQP